MRSRLSLSLFTLLIALLGAAPAFAQSTLYSADFTGGVLWPHVGGTFDGIDSNGANSVVTGDLSFDAALVPPGGSGYVNVAIPSGNPIFDISIGSTPLSFSYAQGDGLAMNSLGGNINGFVQYNNGSFAGVVFNGDFVYNSTPYRLDMQGSLWTIYQLSMPGAGGYEIGSGVAYGYLNSNLTNIQSIPSLVGAVPEPSTYLTMTLGILALFLAARRRHAGKRRLTPLRIDLV